MKPVIDKYGTKRWYDEEGKLHRDDDLPAIEKANGDLPKEWYRHGVRHREGGAAVIFMDDGVFMRK